MVDIGEKSLAFHRRLKGKISIASKSKIRNKAELSLVYTPGVGAVCRAIAETPDLADDLTWRRNTVAVVSDGSAVLGLGNIGPLAALPVMEGKCAIFKRFVRIDAIPIVLSTQDPEEIIRTVMALEPSFGAIQLEDIAAPHCFEVEDRLARQLKIPVMHDDQHGTAIVVLAGLWNAMKVTKRKDFPHVKIVLSGAGAAGTAIVKLLRAAGFENLVVCDRQGAIWKKRPEITPAKLEIAKLTNIKNEKGPLETVIRGADVFVGISAAGALSQDLVKTMAPRAIVFAMANPTPEILPVEALKAGAAVVATGRSDFPNQLNNALVYPGLFRGMLDRRVTHVTDEIKLRAAKALAGFVSSPTSTNIVPSIFEKGLHEAIAKSVR